MTLSHYQPPREPFLQLLYADADIAVVNKPSGLLSVPGKDPAHRDSAWTRLRYVYPDARIVHRLDMATSGIILFGLHKQAQAHLQRQFERRVVTKQYVAIVWGKLPAEHGFIDLPLRCDWPNRPRQMVCYEHGRHAQTFYQVEQQQGPQTRVTLYPHTGRSHQLRVHMQMLGTPIVGDKFYASAEAFAAAPRLLLHAEALSCYHPNDQRRLSFVCPADF